MSERNDEHDTRGFRQIGSQIPPAARSPKIVDGPPTGSNERSNGSGSITERAAGGSPIPEQPGRSGLPTRATLSLVEALATRDPDKVDRSLLASLPSSIKAGLREHLAEGSYLGPYGFDPVTESFELEVSVLPE